MEGDGDSLEREPSPEVQATSASAQTDTPAAFGAEKNPPLFVYDCSGPYTDPSVRIDIRSGLAPLRQKWIEERNDTEVLGGPTSRYGVERLNDPKLAEMRFNLKRNPRRARIPLPWRTPWPFRSH